MSPRSKALASILISFVVATLTISVAPSIDSKPKAKSTTKEPSNSVFQWGEGSV